MNVANRANPIKVAVIAYPGISPFHLAIPCVVFHDAFALRDNPFQLTVCSVDGASVATQSALSLSVPAGLGAVAEADLVIVSGWVDATTPAPEPLLKALGDAHQRGATLVGLCLGSAVLAQTGLLNGFSATTHWAYAEAFARAYPDVVMDPDPLFLDHGRLVTSAGMAAAMDCCLHLLRRYQGSELASEIARILVASPYRSGGQKQYIPTPVVPRPSGASELGLVLDEVLQALEASHSVESVAARCAMSRRTFTRRFKDHTGMSFTPWLTAQRLKFSQQLLEQDQHSIARVAELSGFGSESVFRKHFRAAFEVPPSQWRRQFGHNK